MVPREQLEALIEEGKNFGPLMDRFQAAMPTVLRPHEIEGLQERYHDWYAQSVQVLQGLHDDLKRDFQQEYFGVEGREGIRDFIANPIATDARAAPYDARTGQALFESKPYWKYPYQRLFAEPFQRQLTILEEARSRLVAEDLLPASTELPTPNQTVRPVGLLGRLRTELDVLWDAVHEYQLLSVPMTNLSESLCQSNLEIMGEDEWARFTYGVERLSQHFGELWDWQIKRNMIEPSEAWFDTAQAIGALKDLVDQITAGDLEEAQQEVRQRQERRRSAAAGAPPKVFVAHGRSFVYHEVLRYLRDELKVEAVTFETEDHTAQQITEIVSGFVREATAAIIVMTGEDETKAERKRARQNVIHEAGLFQASVGFDRVALLMEEGIESFTNVSGLIYIPFNPNHVRGCFYDLRRFLEQIKVLSP